MLPFRHWLRRADLRNDPRTVALVLPDGMSLAYADLAATAGAPGLNVLTGGAGGMALGLAACALGGGSSDQFSEATGIDYHEETSVGELLLGEK